MKKYTLKDLTSKIANVKSDTIYWESACEKVRRIDRTLKRITGIKEITDINIDKYIEIYRDLYNNDDKMLIINKYCRILNSIQSDNGVMAVALLKKSLTKEEEMVVYKILLECFRGEEMGYFLEQAINEIISEEYNEILLEFEEEVKRIKLSIQGYGYEAKVEKMKEIKNYLKSQRMKIDKDIFDNLVIS